MLGPMAAAPSTGRRRPAALALLLAVLAASAGCTGALSPGDGTGSGDAAPATALVPADANAVTYVDVDRALTHDTLRRVWNASIGDVEGSIGPDTVDGFVVQASRASGLPADGLVAATGFTSHAGSPLGPNATDTSYRGTIIASNWTAAGVARSVENTSDVTLEETTYAGHTVYEAPRGHSSVGALDDRLVVGNLTAVRDVLEVAAGDEAALEGDLLAAFEDTRDGYVRYASAVGEDQVPTSALNGTGAVSDPGALTTVERVSGALYVDGDTVGATLTMAVAGGEDAALDLRDVVRGAFAYGRTAIENTSAADRYGGLLERDSVDVEQSGSSVTVVSENPVAEITPLVSRANEST